MKDRTLIGKGRVATCPKGHTHELSFTLANHRGVICPDCKKKYPNSEWVDPQDYKKNAREKPDQEGPQHP